MSNGSKSGTQKPKSRIGLVVILGATAAMAGLVALRLAPAPGAPPGSSNSGPPSRQSPKSDELPESSAGGLMLVLESRNKDSASGVARDTLVSRMVALHVPEGAPPTPFLPAGPFRATWTGTLNIRYKDTYSFSADGRGKIAVKINGVLAFEASGENLAVASSLPIPLAKGAASISVEYESPERGAAGVRVFWESDDFPREPLQPGALTHNANAAPLQAPSLLREGRELAASLRCVKCHADAALSSSSSAASAPHLDLKQAVYSGRMPELDMDAPSLADAGARLNVNWMAHWISDPRALRADAAMPRLALAGTEALAAAYDIAAYLATLEARQDPPETEATPEAIALGGLKFAQLGCFGCHARPDNADPEKDKDRVPLRNVKAKWKPRALREFLRKPERHYEWIRMPNFRLTEVEADALAAFLLARAKGEFKAPAGLVVDAQRGMALVEKSGCMNCHVFPTGSFVAERGSAGRKLENAFKAPAWSALGQGQEALSRGCLASTPHPGPLSPPGRGEHRPPHPTLSQGRGEQPAHAPDFALSDNQRSALRAFLATDRSALAHDTLPEAAERAVRSLRCNACHDRDSELSVWHSLKAEVEDLAAAGPKRQADEEEEPPPEVASQDPPPLTWVGEKLKPDWMARFIAGQVPYKPRPWMRARMPGFARRAHFLAAGLALQHGCSPIPQADSPPDEEKSKVGRQLIGQNGGFSCISCHAVAANAPLTGGEGLGPNLMYAQARLRPEFFLLWVRKPMRFDGDTKMPEIADRKGKTAFTELYNGDALEQFQAVWQYLLHGEKIEPPEE